MTAGQKELQTDPSSLELLYPISRELSGALDVEAVLEKILFLSMQAVGGSGGSLIVLGEDEQPVDGMCVENDEVIARGADKLLVAFRYGLAGWVARTRQVAWVPDTRLDGRWLHPGLNSTLPSTRSAICTPILVQDQLTGILTLVHTQVNGFSAGQLALFQSIAGLAGPALQQAQLFGSLQTAHRRYHELFEDSMDPILITNWDGYLIEFNRRAQEVIRLNLPATGIPIQSLEIVNPEKVGEDFRNLRTGETIQYEASLHRETEGEIPVQVCVRQVRINGQPHLQWILRDITERKHLDHLREDLTSMIYHDLRSPLGNIVSSLDVINSLLDAHQIEELHPLLNIAMRSTERIQRLTNSLLDINWLEAGQPITNQQVYDLDELTREAIEAVETAAQSKEVRIVRKEMAGWSQVFIDAEMIRRVLINLLENAIKYTPTGSKIILGVEQARTFVHLWIQDEGPGIPPEAQAMIFDKFARLTAKGDQRGFGLGLAYCRLAVQGHGGKIWVESQPGHGASFHLTLPISVC